MLFRSGVERQTNLESAEVEAVAHVVKVRLSDVGGRSSVGSGESVVRGGRRILKKKKHHKKKKKKSHKSEYYDKKQTSSAKRV